MLYLVVAGECQAWDLAVVAVQRFPAAVVALSLVLPLSAGVMSLVQYLIVVAEWQELDRVVAGEWQVMDSFVVVEWTLLFVEQGHPPGHNRV